MGLSKLKEYQKLTVRNSQGKTWREVFPPSYAILGCYRGKWEVLDRTTEGLEEARKLADEYRLAFRGQGWYIKIHLNGKKVG